MPECNVLLSNDIPVHTLHISFRTREGAALIKCAKKIYQSQQINLQTLQAGGFRHFSYNKIIWDRRASFQHTEAVFPKIESPFADHFRKGLIKDGGRVLFNRYCDRLVIRYIRSVQTDLKCVGNIRSTPMRRSSQLKGMATNPQSVHISRAAGPLIIYKTGTSGLL